MKNTVEALLLVALVIVDAAVAVLVPLVALLLTVAQWRPAVAPPRMAPPHHHQLAALADELARLTVPQLQAVTGSRRRLRKAQLIAMALAG